MKFPVHTYSVPWRSAFVKAAGANGGALPPSPGPKGGSENAVQQLIIALNEVYGIFDLPKYRRHSAGRDIRNWLWLGPFLASIGILGFGGHLAGGTATPWVRLPQGGGGATNFEVKNYLTLIHLTLPYPTLPYPILPSSTLHNPTPSY